MPKKNSFQRKIVLLFVAMLSYLGTTHAQDIYNEYHFCIAHYKNGKITNACSETIGSFENNIFKNQYGIIVGRQVGDVFQDGYGQYIGRLVVGDLVFNSSGDLIGRVDNIGHVFNGDGCIIGYAANVPKKVVVWLFFFNPDKLK